MLTGAVAMTLSLFSAPSLACTIDIPPLNPGESQEAYASRMKTEQIDGASETERALAEQRGLWELSSVVFLARVERVKIEGTTYPRPMPKKKRRLSHGDRRLAPPQFEPFLSSLEPHQAYLTPILMIKGTGSISPAWHSVGGMTSCGTASDGDLGYAAPGDEIVIFGQHPIQFDRAKNAMVELEELWLDGIARVNVVDPHVLEALEARTPPNN